MKNINLTTQISLRNALSNFGVAGWLVRKGLDAFDNAIATPEKQSEAAARVIREGKEAGVDEMEIVMSHEAGVNFKAPIEGVKISMKAGAEGTITMKVKYK